ncbi:alpha/beta hydrolase [Aeromicrobium wangtongii]|uniref:Alpha/beta hydrolase n=1 Tax=Aeromicrobium wangtongii TaxID=2969247 RepID=A0ABY5MAL5_9ACTN|nr:alpha/beta hydrolase [Aeromicrobium wangtongii]MCD9199658.1 alpha/beta hydrolase [Aeromicrobium wangtongii]UUP14009.1 alpha/beta hydrolase [Aeromicrobium wangtongii]
MTRARTPLLIGLVVALLLGLVVYAAYATRAADFDAPSPLDAAAPQGLEKFYTQDLDWSECGRAHCAWVTVPIDYADPDGPTTRVRMALYPATGESKRSVFVNPGGPGGSAIDFAGTMAGSLGGDVREHADVVGVDPRGVGLSTPLTCLSDRDFDAYTASDPDPDDAQEIAAQRKGFTELGEACVDGSGDLAAHVSTVEAARDMDVVRALLGRKKLDWFGASYGTELGAVYAELFPDRVGRMVLDGAVDPTLDSVESSFGQATGFQRALQAYAEDCVARDDCPLGDDADAGVAKIADLMDQLDAKPLPGDGKRQLTEGLAFYGIAVTLYEKEAWPTLTQALRAAFNGDGKILVALSDIYFGRQDDGTYESNQGQVISAVNCLDTPEGLTEADVEAQIPRFVAASPVFGRALAWGALGCSDWPIEATSPLPEIDGKGAPPIVVVGTTRDPATPYESAKALASQLDSAVLLTRDGDGHTAYLSGNACITKAIDRYLADGTVPKDGTRC